MLPIAEVLPECLTGRIPRETKQEVTTLRARRDAIDLAFYVLSFFFACGAIFHSFAAAIPTIDPEAPTWRHLLFVGINLACIAGFLFRPLFFLPVFSVLVVQQIVTHGSHAWRMWQDHHGFDAPSVGVVLVMPLAVVLLIADARRKKIRGATARAAPDRPPPGRPQG